MCKQVITTANPRVENLCYENKYHYNFKNIQTAFTNTENLKYLFTSEKCFNRPVRVNSFIILSKCLHIAKCFTFKHFIFLMNVCNGYLCDDTTLCCADCRRVPFIKGCLEPDTCKFIFLKMKPIENFCLNCYYFKEIQYSVLFQTQIDICVCSAIERQKSRISY